MVHLDNAYSAVLAVLSAPPSYHLAEMAKPILLPVEGGGRVRGVRDPWIGKANFEVAVDE